MTGGALLSDARLPSRSPSPEEAEPQWFVNSRIEAERDFDRILFATPTRRLGDKTQVFPLEKPTQVRACAKAEMLAVVADSPSTMLALLEQVTHLLHPGHLHGDYGLISKT